MVNKRSYFTIQIDVKNEFTNSEIDLENPIDQILYAMGSSNNDEDQGKWFNKNRIIIIFKVNTRKRRTQLEKYCESYLPLEMVDFKCRDIKKRDISTIINSMEKKGFKNESNNCIIEKVVFEDTKVFENHNNWFEWQKQVYKMIYKDNKHGKIVKPDHREIISLVDIKGNSGKSSFFKFLYSHDKERIGRFTYGTAGQLRSAAVNLGEKKVYIIDLARTKAPRDSEEDLLAVIEDLKSGILFSPFYGKNNELIMNPPIVIISSNYKFSMGTLSKDRWSIYEIKNKKLGRKNKILNEKKLKK